MRLVKPLRVWLFNDSRSKMVRARNLRLSTPDSCVRIQGGNKKLALTNTLAGKNLGMVLLGIWLILTGLLPLLDVRLSPTLTTVLAVLAIAAGLLILLRR